MGLTAEQLHAYVGYLRDMGIYDLYRQDDPQVRLPQGLLDAAAVSKAAKLAIVSASPAPQLPAASPRPPVPLARQPTPPAFPTTAKRPVSAPPSSQSSAPSYFDLEPAGTNLPEPLAAPMPRPPTFDQLAPFPVEIITPEARPAALEAVRVDIGDCTRCPLAYAGRHNIVFADGDPNAQLMFVGEGPGADEDASGLPFVGKAGQLLNNMIGAMGLKREQVYIANIVKCRPPGNRTPEFVEATTCSQFLLRQIDIVRPQVIVALGSTAAAYLLGVRQPLASLRGRWHSTRGAKLVVTYHPAFLLRDPRQKGEAWKDLQMVMSELGLSAPVRK